ncbi:MAG: phenylacetate-coenzyme A ligase PaaK-like adenylate-forming protein [Glaciecola sp.]|jgi:phenylacetate-coenzyme A ligase PaaK-like adenylate-forming protein
MYDKLIKAIFKIKNTNDFELLALEVYRYQYKENNVYREFCQLILKTPDQVKKLLDIPFLPIAFFKTQQVICGNKEILKSFSSSGTMSHSTSKHHLTDLSIYKTSFSKGFKMFFPNYEKVSIIALLPSYMERDDSSLVYMVNDLIKNSNGIKSGFYKKLNSETLDYLTNDPAPKILIGVSFALLELAESKIQLKNTKVIETGGMKGMRKELIRQELHETLQKGLDISKIHSEYGMTELLSQAYLTDENFQCPPWMKTLARDVTDPMSVSTIGKGAINVIDLANLNSCSFIGTDDLGEIFPDGTFDVKGRLDHSLARGCNLLV